MRSFTPKIGIMAIVLLLAVSAIFLVSKRDEPVSLSSSASQVPNNAASTLAANAEKSAGPGIGEYYTGPSTSPVSTSSANPKPLALKTYIYPGATTKSSTALKLELESSDSPEKITEWYKKTINDLNFNAKSFSQTNTNDDILNKLSAAKPGEKLDVTIKKDQTTSKVLITVDRS